MDNALRKRLEILKSRAKEIRRLYRLRHGFGAPIEIGEPCTLVDAVPGEEIGIGSSALYLVRTDALNVVRDAPGLAESFARLGATPAWRGISLGMSAGGSRDPSRVAKRDGLPQTLSGEHFCFFDIETTGLTPSTYAFLCGMMYLRDGEFVIDQAFARDYSEESGMLLYTRQTLERFPVLVTYNGASFDVPFVKTRMAVGRIEYEGPQEHVDLLMPARQRFGGVLPNCKLGTIERHLRSAEREGDIPGSEIPDAYHEFVRTGDAQKIKRILHHNRMDLLAMACLFNHLLAPRQDPIRGPQRAGF
jgi:uncharacterized protein YprB with RNaseH-like and TPR domain